MSSNFGRIEAVSLPVALMKLSVSSAKVASSGAGALDRQERTATEIEGASLRCGGRHVVQACRVAAHLGDLLRLRCQFCRQRCCSSHLLRHSARPLRVSLLFPRGVSPGFACSIPPLGSNVVVDNLHPRVSAHGKDFGTSDNAGVDENDFACRDSAKAEAFVDEPLVDDEPHDLGRVREGVREAGFVRFVFQLEVFLLQSLKLPDRHIRLRVELPYPAHQELGHSADLAQVLGPVHDSLLLCRGLEV